MAKKSDVVIGVIIIVSFLFFSLVVLFAFMGISGEGELSLAGMGKKVAIIDLHGVINNSADIIRQLKKYTKDSSVPAIVMHIDSPGGGVAPSQEIYEEMKKAKENGKRIVASMGSVGASGGYYVACAADTIIANPGTLTGSIGVLLEFPVAEELFKKIGLRFEVVKSGEFKDVGTYNRRMTEAERKLLQSVIDDTYDQFVEVLVENRNLSEEEALKIADGSIFTGRQAKKLGLVDELGDLEDAIKIAGKMGGIEGPPKTIKERVRKVTFFDLLTQQMEELFKLNESEKLMPKLQYIFK
ncbi:MAG: signal peptide peptidase SppA [candidate division Zixibacteria bacterium]|nr:signal peptide peptidase SppA [candidate division Zixibacteria bacterium]